MNEPILKVYKGFANNEVTYVMGHVLRKSSQPIEKISRNPFKNALQMIRRYRLKPSVNQAVILEIDGHQHVTKSDQKGFFEFKIKTPAQTLFQCHLSVGYEKARVLEMKVHNPDVVVVSDIDDTILVSHSTNLLKKLYLLLTKNHERRKGFKGINAFYKRLLGDQGQLFYVSSSEWNLYDFLDDFMSYNHMPAGVFLLQDLKSGLMDLFKSGGGSHQHKALKINKLLTYYADARFVLVGDSGQKDPEIYQQVVRDNPGRIAEVYIRDVRKSQHKKLKNLTSELSAQGVGFRILDK